MANKPQTVAEILQEMAQKYDAEIARLKTIEQVVLSHPELMEQYPELQTLLKQGS